MKRKFTLLLFAIALFTFSKINAQTTYASISSGYWGATSPYIWETYPSGTPVGAINTGATPTSVPSGSHNVYVRSGHAVLTGNPGPPPVNASRNVFNVTIESGGSLSVGNATAQNLRPGTGASGSSGNIAVVTNNGTLGGPTDGLFVEVGVGASSLTMTGTGTTTLQRVRFLVSNLNPAPVLILDQNMTLTVGNNYALSASGSTVSTADNNTLTVNAGKVITIPAGYIHNSAVSSGAAGAIGNYTYNINGTIDMSASTATGSTVFTGSTDATKTSTVNISGTLKLATSGLSSLNLSEAAATGQQGAVIFNINNGGLLDGNLAPINTTTTTLAPRYFRISGTGQLKRTVGAADVLFDIGTSATSHNPVTINNSGTTDNFSVNVKNTIDNAPPTANVVNKQWTINEELAGGSNATVKLGWVATDQAAGFNPAASIVIYRYNGTSYQAYPATITGSGSVADPYIATATGVTSFSPFIVANGTPAPVNFLSAKAYSKNSGVQVEWSTAQEFDLSQYVIERSADGKSFSQAGIVTPNNTVANTYFWYDASPIASNNFYRIKSVDLDGKTKFTGILRVSIGKSKADVIISPNPVIGLQANIQLVELPKGLYSVKIYSSTGQSVYSESIAHNGGSYSSGLQLPRNMLPGVYSLEVSGSDASIKKMIVVQ